MFILATCSKYIRLVGYARRNALCAALSPLAGVLVGTSLLLLVLALMTQHYRRDDYARQSVRRLFAQHRLPRP
jgi:hypothetical protein